MNRSGAFLFLFLSLCLLWNAAAQTPAPPPTPAPTAIPQTNAPAPVAVPAPAAAPAAETAPYFKAHQAVWDQAPPAETATAPKAASATETGWGYYVPRMLMGLFVVCGLILLLAAGLRRFGKNNPMLAGPRLGSILGRIHLSPKASLYYVRTGGKILVIGLTPNGLTPVAELDALTFDAEQESQNAPNEPPAAGFLEQLRASVKQEAPAPKAADDDLAKLRTDLQRLQIYLQESARDSHET